MMLDLIKKCVSQGILGPEQCPDPDFWSWPIRDESRIPAGLLAYVHGNEVRYYW